MGLGYNTAGFLRLRAVGSGAERAHWAGVAERRTVLAAYAFSGPGGRVGGARPGRRSCSGDPNIGTSYILNSLAAAVIGGVSLLGGSGSFAGVLGGAMVLRIVNNVVFALGLTAYLEPAIGSGILAVAVFTTGDRFAQAARRWGRDMTSPTGSPRVPRTKSPRPLAAPRPGQTPENQAAPRGSRRPWA